MSFLAVYGCISCIHCLMLYPSVGSSILGGTTGWNMEVDLGKRLVFPDVVQTTLRPDIVLWSKAGKKLIVIELTVP